jgi:hypothetical protein
MPAIETPPVVVSPTGLAKMEERKRPAAYDGDETAPPAKRQITSSVNGETRSHHDADIPGKDDLEVRLHATPIPTFITRPINPPKLKSWHPKISF